jgi:hypothetical protein
VADVNIAYIAGPYGGPTANEIDENIRRAREVAVALWQLGWAVICPHLNTAHFDGAVYPHDRSADRQVWIRGDLEILNLLRPGRDALVTVPGWEHSSGALGEIAAATNRGLQVYHWPEDHDTLKTYARPGLVVPVPDAPDD